MDYVNDRLYKLDNRINALEDSIGSISSSIDELKNMIKGNNVGVPGGYVENRKRTNEELINDIMDNFDFDVVHKVMKLLDWNWSATSGVPGIEQIKEFAFDLLTRSVKEKTNIASGGFKAEFEAPVNENEEPFLSLSFILTDFETY